MNKCYLVVTMFLCFVVSLGITLAQEPSAPANLAARSQNSEGVILQWDAAVGAVYYKLYKSVDGSPFLCIAATEHLSYIDWLLGHDHHYRYYVCGFNHDIGGLPSDTVEFKDGPPTPVGVYGVITGRITDDSTGLPVREAAVRFFSKDGLWRVNVHTDSGGGYWAPLDTGRYLVRAERFGYVPEWFEDALELSAATVIPVHQDTTVADFGLKPIPPGGPISLSGVVRDSTTGQPLANTFIVLMRPFAEQRVLEHAVNLFGGLEWERLELPGFGRLHGVVWSGFTDSLGTYAAHARSNQRYIAMAFKPGYVIKFFHDKHTPFDADRIRSFSDMSGIDFDLVPNPLASLFISGNVHDTTNSGVLSHVMLIRFTAIGPRVVRYHSTDSLGNYSFGNLVPGTFMVKAVPVDLYAPAWYTAAGCGIRNWHNADTIRLAGSRSGVGICVLPAPERGCGRVTGTITYTGNLDAAAAAQGATVYAVLRSTNEVGGYDMTEDDGTFSISGLAPGTYDIVVDGEGYSANSTPSVTIVSSNNYEVTGTSVTISEDVVTMVSDRLMTIPDVYRLDQNYPNPFNPSTTIGFALPKASVISLKIYNIIGQEVTHLANSTFDAGEYKVQWNGTDLSGKPMGSGIYLFKLSAVSLDGKSSFTRTRKTLLMK